MAGTMLAQGGRMSVSCAAPAGGVALPSLRSSKFGGDVSAFRCRNVAKGMKLKQQVVRPVGLFPSSEDGFGFLKRFQRPRTVEANVAVPTRTLVMPEEKEDDSFDASAPPPFTLSDIRAAIPKHCWEKNVWKSMSYVVRDVAIVFGLAAGAAYLNNWFVWPLYWFAQGTMFWALFVLGHDCGHGSFSNNKALNSFVGHLAHSSILVPFHGWRISHRTHHQNHGHVENDESWHPLTEKMYRDLDGGSRTGRLTLPWAMFAYPFYLWGRSPGKEGSHYDPKSDLFVPSEKNEVLTSTACWTAMVALLLGLTVAAGPMWMLKLYVVPYWLNVVWLDVVTYLHHHGYDKKVPWYRGEEWNYMRGGLSTIDRDYGIFNNIHHDIGTHVVHHLFPQIPHYNLIEATEAVKPVLGKYYREPAKSPGPFPTHLFSTLLKSFEEDHYVKDEGNVVFYQNDPPQ
ncbi:acyl-lipid omega-6 desaturase (Delta-12 desaturase) [Marchantia polymorpha subsp. ruderalis]|uniref:Uncharacterized protein n=2 Tax=Marchantia polymorpha TaxID=3197 RepID=A0AAF6BKH4_MARPO|nr:hypothetical protein MARPO_0058s0050 [Marchantia polymorpha]BAL45581.1 omega-3 desaturase [Marchantia polymorpha]BBN12508.1 hypothetical protein Mp_5g20700 [Marchantia polymorpha subsp. ruderalis]|eukprot:PTQ37262.1 hypothetical protein MARPO_0058s0050 [Marchantia polymorpha]